MPRRTEVEADGYTFVFTHDPADKELLHIYARHLTTIDDALRVWFDEGSEEDVWNEQFQRYETRNRTHVLYWTWLVEGKRVLIITCFRRDD
jgi:hypothetical protein